jgi:hypothetical protein
MQKVFVSKLFVALALAATCLTQQAKVEFNGCGANCVECRRILVPNTTDKYESTCLKCYKSVPVVNAFSKAGASSCGSIPPNNCKVASRPNLDPKCNECDDGYYPTTDDINTRECKLMFSDWDNCLTALKSDSCSICKEGFTVGSTGGNVAGNKKCTPINAADKIANCLSYATYSSPTNKSYCTRCSSEFYFVPEVVGTDTRGGLTCIAHTADSKGCLLGPGTKVANVGTTQCAVSNTCDYNRYSFSADAIYDAEKTKTQVQQCTFIDIDAILRDLKRKAIIVLVVIIVCSLLCCVGCLMLICWCRKRKVQREEELRLAMINQQKH